MDKYVSVFSLSFLRHCHMLFDEWLLKQKRYLYLKKKYSNNVIFSHSVIIGEDSEFEGYNHLESHCFFKGHMGFGSYMGSHSALCANIGRFSSIAPHVTNNIGFHPIGEPFATTSPRFYSVQPALHFSFAKEQKMEEFKEPTRIGNDCWIGQQVFLTGGITIGDGAVVLAGSVVVKDIPPYAIVGGVPAKIIRYRYDEDTIRFLLKIQWWNQSIDWLKENSSLLCDIDKLKQTFSK